MQTITGAIASVEAGCDVEALGSGVAGDSSVFCAVEVATDDNSMAANGGVELIVREVVAAGCDGFAESVQNATGEVRPQSCICKRPQHGQPPPSFVVLVPKHSP